VHIQKFICIKDLCFFKNGATDNEGSIEKLGYALARYQSPDRFLIEVVFHFYNCDFHNRSIM